MLPSGITHLQRRRGYPRRSEAASFPAPSCFRDKSRLSAEPVRGLGRAVSRGFTYKNTWSCELDLRVLPALFLYLPPAALNQVSAGRVSRVLPLLRTGRRARLSAGGFLKCTQLLHVDWTVCWLFTFSEFSLWIYI